MAVETDNWRQTQPQSITEERLVSLGKKTTEKRYFVKHPKDSTQGRLQSILYFFKEITSKEKLQVK